MHNWPDFEIDGKKYDLSHMRGVNFTYERPATERESSKQIRFYMQYSDHCFTEHYGEHIYPHYKGYHERYFCPKRYEHSKGIYQLVSKIIHENRYVGHTFNEHRDQFFYIEENYMDVEYRLFLEVSCSNNPKSDIFIKVVSAYEPRPGSAQVTGTGWHKFLSVVDARINGIKIERKRRR